MGESVVITSGKGGVGKSTLCVHLALHLIKLHHTVALIDADMGLRSLDILLGLEDKVIYDAVDVLEGLTGIDRALVKDPKHPGLALLAASQTRSSGSMTPSGMEFIASALKERYDYVLIDCPAGIGRGFRNAVSGADRAVIVTIPDPAALRSAERVAGRLMQHDLYPANFVINRAPEDPRVIERSIEALTGRVPLRLIGVVPEDGAVVSAAFSGNAALVQYTRAGEAIGRIARRLTGENLPIPAVFKRKRLLEWFGRLVCWLDGQVESTD